MEKGTLSSQFLEFMVQNGVLRFGDFLLKSGRKAPYFINTGLFTTGGQLAKLGGFYAKLIQNSVRNRSYGLGEKLDQAAINQINEKIKSKFDLLFGPAYKGISLVTATASELAVKYDLDMPYAFNRKEPKNHGDGERILGHVPRRGERVALIEDVVTAGTSVREMHDLFAGLNLGAKIVALYISVDRMERGTGDKTAADQIRAMGIELYSITTTWDIIEYLETEGGKKIADAQKHADNIRAYLSNNAGF
ncbi:MAG: orotate phosphoribosyltransferase [Gracilibacteraceae bacterium]|jgi:orotate phosphoribosyltransferase|nr:orotate phosphoribosyltransferase [Gracilibacteraceae bacterium]